MLIRCALLTLRYNNKAYKIKNIKNLLFVNISNLLQLELPLQLETQRSKHVRVLVRDVERHRQLCQTRAAIDTHHQRHVTVIGPADHRRIVVRVQHFDANSTHRAQTIRSAAVLVVRLHLELVQTAALIIKRPEQIKVACALVHPEHALRLTLVREPIAHNAIPTQR